MSQIAVVVPTCRPEQLEAFCASWREQFSQHDATVVVVRDDTDAGEIHVLGKGAVGDEASVLGKNCGIVARKSPACRCLGFAYIARSLPEVRYVVTLDDDVAPDGDTIGDHIAALSRRTHTSWMSSVMRGPHMRGFPYGVRDESPVFVSHGVWKNIPDLDAPTQLVIGNSPEVAFYSGPVPRGVFFPVCGMNLAFRVEAMPYMLWCPAKWLPGAERFDDIWMGVELVKDLSKINAAMVTGFSSCVHTRLSNVYANLRAEAYGIGLNERLWAGKPMPPDAKEFFESYRECRAAWAAMITKARGAIA